MEWVIVQKIDEADPFLFLGELKVKAELQDLNKKASMVHDKVNPS